MRHVVVLVALFAAPGCGGDDDGGSADAPPASIDAPPGGADAPASICGEPGDPGNSIGVGKYCDDLADCSGNTEATICATLGNPQAHFCTKICSADAGPTDCGEMATCVCQSAGCGCTPDACLGP
jgi:hypothetical protein